MPGVTSQGDKALPFDIPSLVDPLVSPEAREKIYAVREFIEKDVKPALPVFEKQVDEAAKATGSRWTAYPSVIRTLQEKAKAKGLWNLFLPKNYREGAGLTNLEYALMAEQMGRVSHIGAEVFNCSAPDTGNMEVLAKYANAKQKKEWLEPLLSGDIRSAFCMTEKGIASSDARNIGRGMSITRKDKNWVISGTKWWSSGAGDPRCKMLLVMGNTSPNATPYRQQSIIIVPRDTPGVEVVRPLTIFGYDDAPHGHMEMRFTNVQVPLENVVWDEGRGFEIMQGRLGPGRIHHCMRTLGAAEEALQLGVARSRSRVTFGKKLSEQGVIASWIAEDRIDITSARLLVLAAAHEMDQKGPKAALELIAMAKIRIPSMALRVIDHAIQIHGGEGVSQDTILAGLYTSIRTLRIADGPDEVHIAQLARRTISKL